MADWYSGEDLDRAHAAWPDLPVENEELATMLLDVAREQVVEFAADAVPADQVTELLEALGVEEAKTLAVLTLLDFDEPAETVRTRYVFAQIQQAKNLWNAGRVIGDSVGPDGFSFVPRPLSKEIQRIIHPTSGVPSVY